MMGSKRSILFLFILLFSLFSVGKCDSVNDWLWLIIVFSVILGILFLILVVVMIVVIVLLCCDRKKKKELNEKVDKLQKEKKKEDKKVLYDELTEEDEKNTTNQNNNEQAFKLSGREKPKNKVIPIASVSRTVALSTSDLRGNERAGTPTNVLTRRLSKSTKRPKVYHYYSKDYNSEPMKEIETQTSMVQVRVENEMDRGGMTSRDEEDNSTPPKTPIIIRDSSRPIFLVRNADYRDEPKLQASPYSRGVQKRPKQVQLVKLNKNKAGGFNARKIYRNVNYSIFAYEDSEIKNRSTVNNPTWKY